MIKVNIKLVTKKM